MRVPKRIVIKALGYRALAVAYEYLLALALAEVSVRSVEWFIAVNNAIKIAFYIVYELIWAGILRTRFNFVDKILSRVRA